MATVPKLADFPDEFRRAHKGASPYVIANMPDTDEREKAFWKSIQRLRDAVQWLPRSWQQDAVTFLEASKRRYNKKGCDTTKFYAHMVVNSIQEVLENKKVA